VKSGWYCAPALPCCLSGCHYLCLSSAAGRRIVPAYVPRSSSSPTIPTLSMLFSSDTSAAFHGRNKLRALHLVRRGGRRAWRWLRVAHAACHPSSLLYWLRSDLVAAHALLSRSSSAWAVAYGAAFSGNNSAGAADDVTACYTQAVRPSRSRAGNPRYLPDLGTPVRFVSVFLRSHTLTHGFWFGANDSHHSYLGGKVLLSSSLVHASALA